MNNKRSKTSAQTLRAQVGAYYFECWPIDVRPRMLKEFADHEPVWGWRDTSLEVMERQIDLAADHGLAFFAFDWYWHDNGKLINKKKIKEDRLHTGLELFLKAKNNKRMKFCLLVANHQGFEIKGTRAWQQAADFWMPYFKHPQHVTVDGKPLVIIFSSNTGDRAGFAYLQKAAKKAGLPGVAIAGCFTAPPAMGYTHLTHYNVIEGWQKGLAKHKYRELVGYQEKFWKPKNPRQPYLPCVLAGWDNRPRENPDDKNQKFCWYYPDRTPKAFAAHLKRALLWMDKHPRQTTTERIVVLYAWNELGEGGYIIPTKGDPQGKYLKALKSVVMPAR
jgi:hypothetical protein